MKFIPFILLVFFSLPVWAERYAVVVNGGGDALEAPWLKESSEKIAKQYRSRGYNVIVIEAELKEGGQAFKDRLAGLKNVESLDLAFLGHGVLLGSVTTALSGEKLESELKRFPYSYLRPDEVEGTDEDFGPYIHYGYVMLPASDEEPDWRKWIGMGDLHEAISKLKLINPRMQTTIRSLNCFGGNAIRAMESIPDVQVYSSSSAYHSSVTLSEGSIYSPENRDYMYYFTQEIEAGKTYGEADFTAKSKFLYNQLSYFDFNTTKIISNFEQLYSIPLSSMESHFQDQCLGKPQKMNLVFCQETPEVNEVQTLGREVTQAMVMPIILEHIELKRRYLESLKSHGLCDGGSIPLSLSLLQKAREAIKNLAQTSEKSLEDFIKQQLLEISSVNNLEDFREFEKFPGLSYIPPHMKKNPDILAWHLGLLPEFKQLEQDKRKRLLKQWQSNDFKQQLKNQIAKLSEGEQDKKCVENLESCEISELIDEWSKNVRDYPIKPAKLLSDFSFMGEEILKNKCPAPIMLAKNESALNKQVDCISKISIQSPLEGLAALNALRNSRKGNNLNFCARVKKEEILLKKIEKCATNYSKIESDDFWLRLLSLRKQQLKSL